MRSCSSSGEDGASTTPTPYDDTRDVRMITSFLSEWREKVHVANVDNNAGDTLIHTACRNNEVGKLKELLASRESEDINTKNVSGYTPLHIVCIKGYVDL